MKLEDVADAALAEGGVDGAFTLRWCADTECQPMISSEHFTDPNNQGTSTITQKNKYQQNTDFMPYLHASRNALSARSGRPQRSIARLIASISCVLNEFPYSPIHTSC